MQATVGKARQQSGDQFSQRSGHSVWTSSISFPIGAARVS
jgi:hypothetical protein